MCKFKIGDKVRLVSDTEDSISMTVDGYRKNESQYAQAIEMGLFTDDDMKSVRCVWRDNSDNPHSEYYHEDSLINIDT